MNRSRFIEKLNKVDGNVYVIEELVQITDGVYEGELQHDNVNTATFAVYTGPKLTGNRIESYVLSTPSMTPWKKVVRVYADVPDVYLSYETEGDTVEAEDVNRVQDAVVETQDALNSEAERAIAAEAGLAQRLTAEEERAKAEELRVDGKVELERERALAAEQSLQDGLTAEEERAVKAEQALQGKLDDEVSRAQERETEISSELAGESARAQNAEKVLTDQLSAEITRAKAAEKANSDAVAAETGRAEAMETELQGNIDAHKAEVDGEIQSLKAADTALDEKKADAADVNRELGDRYTKNQVFTKEEVLRKIEDLIGTAPDTLDTFKEIADALGNDPNFAATIMNALSGKVDKEAGKQLSSNDYSDSEKAIVADVNEKKHTHGNKSVIDKITQALLDHWSAAYTHVSDAVKHITAAERESWNAVTNKVDKVSGKQLSTNDYTTAEKNKLAGIAAGAEVNVQSDWNVTDAASDAFIKNKPSSLPASDVAAWAKTASKPTYDWTELMGKPNTFPPAAHVHTKSQISDMPTKLSQFTNDPGYITQADVDTSQNHTHANKTVLDKVTQVMLDKIAAFSGNISDLTGTMPINKGGTGATSASAALANLGGLPLSGGIMTGDLRMKVGSRTDTPIKLYAGDETGNALVTQSGGLYIAGSGESASNLYAALGLPAETERMFLASDQDIVLSTNCQNMANRKDIVISTAGKITAPGGFSGSIAPTNLSASVPINKGGTGAATAADARTALGAAAASHNHDSTYLKKGAVTWNDLKGGA